MINEKERQLISIPSLLRRECGLTENSILLLSIMHYKQNKTKTLKKCTMKLKWYPFVKFVNPARVLGRVAGRDKCRENVYSSLNCQYSISPVDKPSFPVLPLSFTHSRPDTNSQRIIKAKGTSIMKRSRLKG